MSDNDFRQLIEEKFAGLHAKLDDYNHDSNRRFAQAEKYNKEKFDNIHDHLEKTNKEIKWLNSKVWMAIGGLAVISIVGGVLAFAFRSINDAQLEQKIEPVREDVNDIKNTLGKYEFIDLE